MHPTPGEERPTFLEKPGNVTLLFRIFYVLCGVSVVLDFVIHRHETHPWEHLRAFYPLYGFVGIVALVLVAKVLRRVVMRPEDYYDVD
ncbi:MAG: hypothetical protein OEZ65_10075 [Gemmatimonadota bacterium]|nr:hypothetical protein [Gemmatimonadota bacterium]